METWLYVMTEGASKEEEMVAIDIYNKQLGNEVLNANRVRLFSYIKGITIRDALKHPLIYSYYELLLTGTPEESAWVQAEQMYEYALAVSSIGGGNVEDVMQRLLNISRNKQRV